MERRLDPEIILADESGIVGLIDMANPSKDFICKVNPIYLKKWAEMVLEQFGEHGPVYLSVHTSPTRGPVCHHLSAAMELNDTLQVIICGQDHGDE
jgi:hypothetical protein